MSRSLPRADSVAVRHLSVMLRRYVLRRTLNSRAWTVSMGSSTTRTTSLRCPPIVRSKSQDSRSRPDAVPWTDLAGIRVTRSRPRWLFWLPSETESEPSSASRA